MSRVRAVSVKAAALSLAVTALLAACGSDDASSPGGSSLAVATATRAATVASPTVTPAPPPQTESPGGGAPSATFAASPAPADAERPAAGLALCDLAIPDAAPGAIASPDLLEISGLAASRTQDVLWAHNDSGDTARVFAVGPDGSARATYTVNGAEAVDWEDIAIGPGPRPGASYLYIGDIGDNASARSGIVVYRALEPALSPAASSLAVDADAITLTYPDGAHDAETLLVDPATGDLFIVTKDIGGGPSGVYRASAAALAAPPVVLESVASINFAALEPRREIPAGSPGLPSALPRVPTGGDLSPDGSLIAIRTYGTVWIWHRPPGGSVADAFAGIPCEGPSAVEAQGEAIAFDADGRGYVTASEGAGVPLHHFREQ